MDIEEIQELDVQIESGTEEVNVEMSETGARGYSAYEIAVQKGYAGTEEQWLASLKGYTPQKGVDYFTNADKEEIKDNVLEEIEIPTKVSELENDSGYLTQHQSLDGYAKVTDIPTKISDLSNDDNTVKDSNYVHTDNNFTTTEKNKLAGLNNYDDTSIRAEIASKQPIGDYASKSEVPTKNSQLSNDSGFITNSYHDNTKQDVISDLDTIRTGASKGATAIQEHQQLKTINNQSIVGTGNITIEGGSGGTTNYSDLSNKPKINNVELNGNKTLDDLGIINFSGDYNDLSNKPTIPTVPTSEISANTAARHSHDNKIVLDGITSEKVTEWDNKSTFDGDYNSLDNKPTIPTVPTNVGAFTNDVGYLKEHQSLVDYLKTTDISNWAKASTKPTYTASEVGALSDTIVPLELKSPITLSTNLSTLEPGIYPVNATGHSDLPSTSKGIAKFGVLVQFGGDYKPQMLIAGATGESNTFTRRWLTNSSSWTPWVIPAQIDDIPTKTSELTNDSKFVKDTDYGTSSKAGVVKAANGVNINSSTGTISAATYTADEYDSTGNYLFVGKGTLENVLAGKGYLTLDTLPKYNGEVE